MKELLNELMGGLMGRLVNELVCITYSSPDFPVLVGYPLGPPHSILNTFLGKSSFESVN